MVTNVNQYFLVDLDQFYGIEIGEFPSQIAQVAMFLIDHQMNRSLNIDQIKSLLKLKDLIQQQAWQQRRLEFF